MNDDRPPRQRFGLAGLMAYIVVIGLGIAALRNADRWWACGMNTLALLTAAAAIVGATLGQGRFRRLCTGYAAFSLIYFAADLLPPRNVNSFGFGPNPPATMLIEAAFVAIQPQLKPMLPSDNAGHIYYDQVGRALAIILFGSFGAAWGGFLAGRHAHRPPDERPINETGQEGRR
jgi:hypothetical protein